MDDDNNDESTETPETETQTEEPTGPSVEELQAQISDLTSQLADSQAALADMGAQLVAAKAFNFDQILNNGAPAAESNSEGPSDDDGELPDIDDLFE